MENQNAILPVRKTLPHGPPPFALRGRPMQFVTMNAATRGGSPFLPLAGKMLDCARFYHDSGRWFAFLFLIMPDHVHALVEFPENAKGTSVCGDWKRYVSVHYGVEFQADFFEHRIRDAAELTEKWCYIRNNPVRKNLVPVMDDWPHWIGFDPMTGLKIK